jgi:zinc transport system substrate-binding protein
MFAVLSAGVSPAEEGEKLRVGVTLAPYYSWTKNIVGDRAEVVPLIEIDFNTHNYQPQPEDMKRAATMDIIVVNGIGHDEWAFKILEAAGVADTLPVVHANEDVALIPVSGSDPRQKTVNAHTFIGISSSIPQIYTIRDALMRADPANAEAYNANTRAYVTRLRRMKASFMNQLATAENVSFRCATVHGGYDYLLQEFGLTVTAVIEPNHGSKPTASQLRETIDKIKALDVNVIFTEMHMPDKYVDTIHTETGVRLAFFTHMTDMAYAASAFEEEMQQNLSALTRALLEKDAA